MKFFFKVLMLCTQNIFFSFYPLRELRWWAYRKYFLTCKFYVAENVKIVSAHNSSFSTFKVGNAVHIGEYAYIDYSGGVELGNHVAISEGVKIFTHNHNVHGKYKNWNKNPISFSNLLIKDFAWVGANTTILESVSCIEEGSIIAAGSVLTKNTEPYSIYAGNPAKKIGTRHVEET